MAWHSCSRISRAAEWDHGLIALGLAHLDQLSQQGDVLTIWHLRAEIASLHAMAPSAGETDWPRIASVYEQLVVLDPSPMVELARAVAIARARGARRRPGGPAGDRAAIPMARPPAACSSQSSAGTTKREATSAVRLSLARTTPERRLMQRRLAGLAT